MSVFTLKPWPKPKHMITLRNRDGVVLTYEPAEDITGYEAALNSRLLACAFAGSAHVEEFFNDMPDGARRHWVALRTPEGE